MKKSFILHYDSLSVIDKMSDEQVGKLMRMMKSYHNWNTYVCDDFSVELVFEQFKNQFDRDAEKYEEKTEEKSIAWRVWNLKRRHPKIYKEYKSGVLTLDEAEYRTWSHSDNSDRTWSQSIANIAVNDNVSVNDNDNKKENNILFDEFWSLYPNKKWKETARKKYPHKNHDEIMLWLHNQIKEFETKKKLEKFVPERQHWSTWINKKTRLDYQDSDDIQQMEFEAIYQEYCKDYENNYAENRKKKYWISKDPDSLFVKVKARFNKEFIP